MLTRMGLWLLKEVDDAFKTCCWLSFMLGAGTCCMALGLTGFGIAATAAGGVVTVCAGAVLGLMLNVIYRGPAEGAEG